MTFIRSHSAPMIAAPTDVALGPAPIEDSWIRAGTPQARNAVLSRSADGMSSTVLWECTGGEFQWIYDCDETIYFLDGSATIADVHNPPRRFGAGDVLFLPRGAVATWVVHDYVRKLAFCRTVPPTPVALALKACKKLSRVIGKRQAPGFLFSGLVYQALEAAPVIPF